MATRLMSSKSAKVTAFVVIALAAVMVPGLVFAMLGFPIAAGVAGVSAMGTFIAAMKASLRAAVSLSLATAVTASLTVLGAPYPWVAAVIFFVSGLLVGLVAERGLRASYAFIPITAGFVLAAVRHLEGTPIASAFAVGVGVLIASLIAAVVSHAVTRNFPAAERERVGHERAIDFGIVLGLMLAITAWFVSRDDLAHFGAWIILTLVVIVQPNLGDSWRKTLDRAVGTILGFFISIGIATTIDSPVLLYVAAVVAVGLAAVALVDHKPYWMYATALTVGVVILEGSSSSILDTAKERLWATVVAALAALVVMALVLPLANWRSEHLEGRAGTERR